MSFVNELIPEEEKARFRDRSIWTEIDDYWSWDKEWTIDHEREVFLIVVCPEGGGLGSEWSAEFAMSWYGEVIKICAFEDREAPQGIMSWCINEIDIPENLEPKEMEIIDLIKEALDVFGDYFSRDYIKEVQVTVAKRSSRMEAIMKESLLYKKQHKFTEAEFEKYKKDNESMVAEIIENPNNLPDLNFFTIRYLNGTADQAIVKTESYLNYLLALENFKLRREKQSK